MFEDKEVVVINSDGESNRGVIAACEEGIGITVVDKDDKDSYLWCLKMQHSPKFYPGPGQVEMTNTLYERAVRAIETTGVLDMLEIHSGFLGGPGGGSSSATCAFSS